MRQNGSRGSNNFLGTEKEKNGAWGETENALQTVYSGSDREGVVTAQWTGRGKK